jgi:thiosulfate reductase cytochrome b subunit
LKVAHTAKFMVERQSAEQPSEPSVGAYLLPHDRDRIWPMARADSASLAGLAPPVSDTPDPRRHAAIVRVTHWINALSFFGLLVSGFAILLAHPRFYWGEAGGIGTPSVLDLPLPFMKGGPSGWGRNLHFLSAWVCVINGSLYAISGLLTRHFRKDLLPAKADLRWQSIWRVASSHLRFERPGVETSLAYDVLQRFTYLSVVFVLLPLMIWTGFAMAPAIVSAFPAIVTILGGQQSARTIHFFAADLLVLFLLVHLTMVSLAGFRNRVRAMITGRSTARVEHP